MYFLEYPAPWLDKDDPENSTSIFFDKQAKKNLEFYQGSKAEAADLNQGGTLVLRKSLSRLKELRKKEFYPDPSFDITGDGMVSHKEMQIASLYDVDRNGVLDDEER